MTAPGNCVTAFVDLLSAICSFSRNLRRKPRWDWAKGKKKHPVDTANGTENSPANSLSLFAVMLGIDISSSILGHLHTSKPKLHHSSHFDYIYFRN